MSRIGRAPVKIPEGVTIGIEGTKVTVESKKGKLETRIHPNMIVEVDDSEVKVKRPDDAKINRSLHGLTRSLINNMVVGVTDGYQKNLEIVGVGYRVAKEGKKLVMNVGYSHQVIMPEPEGIEIEVPTPNKIIIKGIDKQKVGQFAAEVRGKRPPEPYKGKGIRYENEVVRRKEGKSGVKK